jgi:hypothetical protein
MDPKTLSNLDPKLRETYERVMGTAGTPAVTGSAPSVVPPPAVDTSSQLATPLTTTPQIPTPTATPVMDTQLSTPPPATNESFQTPVIPANEPAPLPSPASVNQDVESRAASPVIRILYIIGALVFFGVYTFFWMKVFNLKLPF